MNGSLWNWFWYRMFGECGFPWLEFFLAMFVGAFLVGMGVFVGWLVLH